MRTLFLFIVLFISTIPAAPMLWAQQSESGEFRIARVEYRGGGDWYNDPSALSNLIRFAKGRIPVSLDEEYDDVAVGSSDLHKYPFAFLTGHGTISINESEAENLRSYLQNGGFLYIDDDYGLDEHARAMMEEVFPDEEFIELPFEHPIYHQVFEFPDGLPKIHEHDGMPPQGFGIFLEGRLVAYYSYESNLGDGWTNADVHETPEELRQQALRMGTNILVYALTSGR